MAFDIECDGLTVEGLWLREAKCATVQVKRCSAETVYTQCSCHCCCDFCMFSIYFGLCHRILMLSTGFKD